MSVPARAETRSPSDAAIVWNDSAERVLVQRAVEA